MKAAYLTDSGTGKSSSDLEKDGIISFPLQVIDEEKSYQDMEEVNIKECLQMLKDGKLLKTSQPIYGVMFDKLQELKNKGYDTLFSVNICNGLSGTISSLTSIAEELNLKLISYDTHVTAVVQEYLIKRIKELNESGKPLEEITAIVENVIEGCNTLIIPSNLKYLKRGGRLSPLAYGIAEIMKIIPVLEINKKTRGKIDVNMKVRTYKKAIEKTIDLMVSDIKNDNYMINIAHVDCIDKAIAIKEVLKNKLPDVTTNVIELCNTVSAHTGLDTIAIQYFEMI